MAETASINNAHGLIRALVPKATKSEPPAKKEEADHQRQLTELNSQPSGLTFGGPVAAHDL